MRSAGHPSVSVGLRSAAPERTLSMSSSMASAAATAGYAHRACLFGEGLAGRPSPVIAACRSVPPWFRTGRGTPTCTASHTAALRSRRRRYGPRSNSCHGRPRRRPRRETPPAGRRRGLRGSARRRTRAIPVSSGRRAADQILVLRPDPGGLAHVLLMEAMDAPVIARDPVISLGHENGGVGDLLNPRRCSTGRTRGERLSTSASFFALCGQTLVGLRMCRGIAVDWSAPVSGDPGEQEFVLAPRRDIRISPAGVIPSGLVGRFRTRSASSTSPSGDEGWPPPGGPDPAGATTTAPALTAVFGEKCHGVRRSRGAPAESSSTPRSREAAVSSARPSGRVLQVGAGRRRCGRSACRGSEHHGSARRRGTGCAPRRCTQNDLASG